MDDYDDQLYSSSKKITDQEKKILVENCKRISKCDGYVHEKEFHFLQYICSVMNYQ